MGRIAVWVMGTISGLVLIFSYHTSLGPGDPLAGGQGSGGGGGQALGDGTGLTSDGGQAAASGDASPSPGATGATATGKAKSGTKTSARTITGDEVQTRWGPVQVRIVIQNGKITKAQAIEFPNENGHDQEINSWAIPQLQDATVAANSAQIDSLSGATVTSGGYIASLQSALDKAHQ
jgi:uncharacterized protein with FMN-binding domain